MKFRHAVSNIEDLKDACYKNSQLDEKMKDPRMEENTMQKIALHIL
jgi:hypothetical protein